MTLDLRLWASGFSQRLEYGGVPEIRGPLFEGPLYEDLDSSPGLVRRAQDLRCPIARNILDARAIERSLGLRL